jgi:hypothetical protein
VARNVDGGRKVPRAVSCCHAAAAAAAAAGALVSRDDNGPCHHGPLTRMGRLAARDSDGGPLCIRRVASGHPRVRVPHPSHPPYPSQIGHIGCPIRVSRPLRPSESSPPQTLCCAASGLSCGAALCRQSAQRFSAARHVGCVRSEMHACATALSARLAQLCWFRF